MENRILTLIVGALIASAVVALGFVSGAQAHDGSHDGIIHTHHAHPGAWKSGGWTQWHNMPGYTQLGSVGTQLFQVHEQKVVGFYPHSHGHFGDHGSSFHGGSLPVMAASCACAHGQTANTPCACMKGACVCGKMHGDKK